MTSSNLPMRSPSTELVNLRHALHQRPEIGLTLPATQALVLDALSGLGLEITTGSACSSVIAVLRGGAATGTRRPSVLLRGDMDALPVQEEVDVDFRSLTDGVMHACGHDLHTAILVGAAHRLARDADQLAGDVVFMFQPGEEGFDGAGVMIDEGVLTASGELPSAAWAVHVATNVAPRGVVASRQGALLASSSELSVTVKGAGGHGSAPDQARDPISAAAEMVLALEHMVGRAVSAFAPAVLNVGEFHAGTKSNIIPAEARFAATVRSFDEGVMAAIERRCHQVCRGIADAHALDVDVVFNRQYPTTLNDARAVTTAEEVVAAALGPQRWSTLAHPLAGAEDFSRVLQRVPGAMLFLGAAVDEDWESAADNHSPLAAFDDAVLEDGALLLSELARFTLATAGQEAG